MNQTVDHQEPLSALPAALLSWYDAGHRILPWRSEPTPYHVWLSEIMLQQTRVEAVIGYYERFLTKLPTIAALAEAPSDQLLKLWEGLGYYNRARNLQRAAQQVMAEFGGELPADYDALLKLPGIGPYSAGAIGSIAFGLALPAVDGNVLRVVTRLTASEENTSRQAVKNEFARRLSAILPQNRPGDFNQGMMELGATVCLPNGAPLCERCPCRSFCKAHELAIETAFPVKDEKRPRKQVFRTVFVLVKNGKIALRRRPNSGLLRGLWELPGADETFSMPAAADFLSGFGSFSSPCNIGSAVHVFTHREWLMTGYIAVCHSCKDESFVWVSLEELAQDYCLPSAFRFFADQIPLLMKGN